jgi:ABC-2 type transport system ATP-binding protein
MIEVERVTKRFGELVALDGVSLEVQPGQIFGLIGPNGAGKTTLLRVLAGLLAPEAGVARIGGHDVLRDELPARRRFGYMPDFLGLYDRLTVREYLQFFGELNGLEGEALDRAVDGALAAVRLKLKKDDYVDHLSRGMTQRLGFARTLVHEPDVLLLDEPASGLDPGARLELWDILRTLAARGKAILISSHILKELEALVTHVGVLEGGRLAFCGVLGQLSLRQSRRRVRLRPRGEAVAGRAMAVLAENGARLCSAPADVFWEIELADDDRAVAALVHGLVTAGVDVVLPPVAEDRLERAYLDLTGREQS